MSGLFLGWLSLHQRQLEQPRVPSQNSISRPRLHLRKYKPCIDPMLNIIFKAIFSSLRSCQFLVLQNIALRHQLEVLRRNNKTPRLKLGDHTFGSFCPNFTPDGETV